MPFKHEKISYGLPQDEFDTLFIKELCEDLDCALNLSRIPVGIQLFFNEDDYNNSQLNEPTSPLSYCCIIEKATRGKSFKAKLNHINCDGGTTALNLEPSTNRIESGEEYFSYNLYKTPAAARRVREGVPGLYRTVAKTFGIAVSPLKEFTTTPDVVIFIANPYQVMRIQQGYMYHEGGRIEITGAAMQAICAEATVEPYLTGRLNITTLCPSTRFLAKWKDEEMAVGIPFEKFQNIVEGVIATINTTDIKKRKEKITERFKFKNKSFEFNDMK